jgi:putative ABC transport system substrate-binding protein
MKYTIGFTAIVLCCALANAQPAMPKVGFLGASTPEQAAHLLKAFKQGMLERGYEEGKNYQIETRFADGKLDRLPALAAELVDLKVDVIMAPPHASALAAKKVAPNTPIVFALIGDPVSAGFAQSLARPGGNMTGLSTINVELGAKRLELLKEAFPKITRVAVFYNPGDATNDLQLVKIEQAAKTLGLQLLPLAVGKAEGFEPAFARILQERADAVLVVENPVNFTSRDSVVAFANKSHLPAMYALKEFVDAGGLMSYSVSFAEQVRSAATYVDKIFKGAKPGELPVEQPTRIELIINLKVAETLGLKISPSLMLRADQVIR